MTKTDGQVDFDESTDTIGKKRNPLARDNYKRPTTDEYHMIRLRAVGRIEAMIELLRSVDAKLEDAAVQFERYQKRTHGSFGISYSVVDGMIYPNVLCFHFDKSGRKNVATRMTDDDIKNWKLDRWSREHRNPGAPFKAALRGVLDLMEARREIMLSLSDRSSSRKLGTAALSLKVKSAVKHINTVLDDLVAAMEYDWTIGGEPVKIRRY